MTDTAAAERILMQRLNADAADGEALLGLGILRRIQGRTDEAVALFDRAAANLPAPERALSMKAACLGDRGDADGATAATLAALVLAPATAEAWGRLASLLNRDGGSRAALDCLDRALVCAPGAGRMLAQRAVQLLHLGSWRDAMASAGAALAADPGLIDVHGLMGRIQMHHGRVEDALACFQRMLDAGSRDVLGHSNMLMTLLHSDAVGPQEVRAAHEAWAARHAGRAVAAEPFPNEPDPDRRLRLGFVSGDMREHSVAFFLRPLLASLDRSRVEVVCLSVTRSPDHVSREIAALADTWIDAARLSDAALEALIRDRRIDVLVDLSGHSRDNRLTMFARRPAPVQVTWLGYPATTGLTAIDYRITDALADPPGAADGHCTETLLRLDGPFLCYDPGRRLPEVTPPPSSGGGPVTFGSFNGVAKLTPRVIAAWSRILAAVPDSRLLLKSRALDDADTRRRLLGLFAAEGIAAERIDLRPPTATTTEHLASYAAIDIALDPFPYNGTTTTCEALAMGVPVVAMAGPDHRSRVSHAILTWAGLDELAADGPEAYGRIAVDLATDRERLAQVRRTLRQRFFESPVCDAGHHARAFEAAIRTAWTAWCDHRGKGRAGP